MLLDTALRTRYNATMTLPTLVACLLAVLFFMAGCLQIAIYVGTAQPIPFEAYLPGLLQASWPLAVAAVLFVLVDMRVHMAESKNGDPEIPEVPRPPRRAAEHTAYFPVYNRESEAKHPVPPAPEDAKRDDLNFFKM